MKVLPLNRKKNLLIAGIVLCVLFVVALLLVQRAHKSVPTLTTYKDADAQVTSYKGLPIIEACNVVSIDELRDKGITLKATQYPNAFKRVYIEGKQDLMLNQNANTVIDAPNNCHYELPDDKDWFDISVYQAAYSDMKRMEADIAENYTPQPDIGDLKVFKAKTFRTVDEDFFNSVNTNKDNEDFILKHNDNALWFRLRDFKQAKREEMLRLIAANFSRLLQKPEARVTLDYNQSPIKGTLYKACELFGSQDAALLLGQNMSPVVAEGYASAPGKRNYDVSTGKPGGHVYVTQECTRTARQPSGYITFALRQYATEEGAKHYIQSAASGDNMKRQQWQPIQLDMSDQAYVQTNDKASTPIGDDRLYVRQGTLVLSFSYHLGKEDEPSAEESTTRLQPVITSVLKKIQ